MLIDAVGYTDANAPKLFAEYSRLRFEDVHAPLLCHLDASCTSVLDIGAGSGRDACWFARKGSKVVAVEPSSQLRGLGEKGSIGLNVEWYPNFATELRPEMFGGRKFDVVLLSAVMMFVPLTQWPQVFGFINKVAKDSALMVLSCVVEYEDPARGMNRVSEEDLIGVQRSLGWDVLFSGRRADLFNRPGMYWRYTIYRR